MHELITIDVAGNMPEGLGLKHYKYLPRMGDWVEINNDKNWAEMYEVVKVAHSSVGMGTDIYIKKVALTADAIKSLCGR